MRVVVAPDKFRGVLTAHQAVEAIARGIRAARPHVEINPIPMADGGEGTLDVLLDADGGQRRQVAAHGPLGEPVDVTVGLIRHASTAVIELAKVAGLDLVPDTKRDPLVTSTYGVGELIRAAAQSGVEEIILAVGGSATVDGGAGLMQGLGLSLIDQSGTPMPTGVGGGALSSIRRVVWNDPPDALDGIQFTIAVDVLNPACGPSGAARVFGPQKGATPKDVETLEHDMAHWADLLEQSTGRLIRDEPGTGAAGGVALPLLAYFNTQIVPGVDLTSSATALVDFISDADLVITGEGRLDRQSLMGKVVGSVGRMCRGADVPCVAIVGIKGEGADDCLAVLDRIATLDAPMSETAARLEQVAGQIADEFL